MFSHVRLRHTAQTAGHTVDKISATEGPALLKKAETKFLIAWDELPDWSKDKEYIHTGFRPLSNSSGEVFQSCFYAHNQPATSTEYTHLLATLWMISLPAALYPYARKPLPDRWRR